MLEPAVWRCAMPMLYISWYINVIARFHFDGVLAPFLIVTATSHTNQNLPAAARCMVDMPIIAATRLERDVKNINLLLRQRLQIALSGEILRIIIICLPNRKRRLSSEFIFIHNLKTLIPLAMSRQYPSRTEF